MPSDPASPTVWRAYLFRTRNGRRTWGEFVAETLDEARELARVALGLPPGRLPPKVCFVRLAEPPSWAVARAQTSEA